MGHFTSVDEPLSLYRSPRLKKIMKQYKEPNQLGEEDIHFLINQAARFETFWHHVKMKHIVRDMILEDSHALDTVIGQLCTEIMHLSATNINERNEYLFDLSLYFEDPIESYSRDQLYKECSQALRRVREMQRTFNKEESKTTIVGEFKHIEKTYGFKVYVTSNSKPQEVLNTLIDGVRKKIVKDKQDAVDKIEKLNKIR